MEKELLSFISKETGQTVSLETRVEDLGDSLEFLELLQAIGAKFKPIPDVKVAGLNTVRDILDAVSG